MIDSELRGRIHKINCNIRNFSTLNKIHNYQISDIPLGGSIKDSIGPWPEYLLHGVKCLRSEKGYCSPCGYSLDGISRRGQADFHVINRSNLKQANYLIDNFVTMVLKKQHRITSERICFAFSSIGSFFSDYEIPFALKKEILKKMRKRVEELGINVSLFIEVRAEDVIEYDSRGKLKEILDDLKTMNTTIILGFESVNDVIRNYSYSKELSLDTFEKSVKILKSNNLLVGAFVFSGLSPLTQSEIVRDFEETIDYLYKNKIMPVVMIENIKNCTLDHFLYLKKRQRLIEPRTTLEILNVLRRKEKNLEPENWLIADPVGGPPEPIFHSFKNIYMQTCNDCSGTILSGIRILRKTHNWNYFDMVVNPEIQDCDCITLYENLLANESEMETLSLEERLRTNIEFAEKNLNWYLRYIMKKEGGF